MTNQQPDDYDLLNSFAHDLKTPLSAVKSYVELVQASGSLNDQQMHFVHRALQGVDRMQRVISDLLNFARLQSGQNLILGAYDLRKITTEVIELFEPLTAANDLTIQVNIPHEHQFAIADERLLRHIFENLIGNAIKYNRAKGSVSVTALDHDGFILIEVRDTGLGIPEDALPHVFRQFYRVDRRHERSTEGNGLGLSIVQAAVQNLGGQIWAKSVEGKGSVFSFTLERAGSATGAYDREPSDDMDDRMQESRENLDDSDEGEAY